MGKTHRDKLHDGNEYSRSYHVFSFHSDIDENLGMPEPSNTMTCNDAESVAQLFQSREMYRDQVKNGNVYSRSDCMLVRNSMGFHLNVDKAFSMPSTS